MKKRPAAAAVNEFTFEIDRTGNSDTTGTLSERHHNDPNEQNEGDDFPKTNATETSTTLNKNKTAAWVDQDDDGDDGNAVDFRHVSDRIRKLRQTKEETHVSRSQYEERLRQRFIQTAQTTANVAWAQTTHANDTPVDPDPNNISTSTSYLHDTTTATKSIPPNLISMKRCPDANRSDPHQSVTKAVQFFHNHDNTDSTLLLTAGLDKTLRFFHCAEEESTKIHGVHCTLNLCVSRAMLLLMLLLFQTLAF